MRPTDRDLLTRSASALDPARVGKRTDGRSVGRESELYMLFRNDAIGSRSVGRPIAIGLFNAAKSNEFHYIQLE